MTNEAYRIIKWHDRHSNYEQTRSGGRWIACPTRFDSLGLARLVREKRGVETFGAYVLMAELAARMPTPGVLANNDHPLTETEISIITGAPEKALGAALALLQSPLIGWIDRVPFPDCLREPSGTPPDESEPSRTCAPPAPPTNLPTGGTGGGDALAAMLRRAGAGGSGAPKLAEASGVTAAALVAHWHDIRQDKSIRKPGSVLASRIKGGLNALDLTPDALLKAIKAGVVERVNGVEVEGRKLGRNDEGVYLDGELVASVEAMRGGEVELA